MTCHEDERDSEEVIKEENLRNQCLQSRESVRIPRHNDFIIRNSYVGLATFGHNPTGRVIHNQVSLANGDSIFTSRGRHLVIPPI